MQVFCWLQRSPKFKYLCYHFEQYSAARLHFCVIILYKGFSPNSFRRVFNYHSGVWLLLSHPIWSQTCSKLQNNSIEDNKRIITWKNSFCWPCEGCQVNSVAHKWRHDSDKTQTNKLEWWMILKISLRAKGGVPKTLLEQKHRLNFLYFPQNTLMLTESREEFSDLHSIFRLRALRYCRFFSSCLFWVRQADIR